NEIHEMPALAEKLSKAVADDPPLALKDGGIFRDGYDADLDQLRNASREGKNWITQLQERETAATGIKSLKVRYNSVFGYFIEIRNQTWRACRRITRANKPRLAANDSSRRN